MSESSGHTRVGRHVVVGAGIAALALGVLWVGWGPGPRVSPSEAPREVTKPAAPTGVGTSAPVDPEAERSEKNPRVQRTPVQGAYAAVVDAFGGSWFSCETDVELPEFFHAGGLHVTWEAPVFSGRATTGEGAAPIYASPRRFDCEASDDPDACFEDVQDDLDRVAVPIANLQWWGGEDGKEAQCSVDPVRLITIRGRVEGATEGRVRSCADRGMDLEDGGFQLKGIAGAPCKVQFSNTDEKASAVVNADGDTSVTLHVTAVEQVRMSDRIDDAIEQKADEVQVPSNYETVLEDPSLTPEARAIVEAWHAKERETREAELAVLEHLREEMAEQAARLSAIMEGLPDDARSSLQETLDELGGPPEE